MSTYEGLAEALRDGTVWTRSPKENSAQLAEMRNSGEPERLLIFVHGFGATPLDYQGLVEELVSQVKPCAVLAFDWGKSPRWLTWGQGLWWANWFSSRALTMENPNGISDNLTKAIEALHDRYPNAKSVWVGHSMGTVFMRDAFDKLGSDYRQRVERLIGIAATSRGYLADDAWKKLRIFTAERWPWFLTLLAAIATLGIGYLAAGSATLSFSISLVLLTSLLFLTSAPRDNEFTVAFLLRGADWITGVRLKWLKLLGSDEAPIMVLIRGKEDTLIGDFDDLEFMLHPRRIHMREPLPGVNHHTWKLTPRTSEQIKHVAKHRQAVQNEIKAALTWTPCQAGVSTGSASSPDARVRVFLVHGIRDLGDWHEPLGYAIEADCCVPPQGVKVVSITYGYFSAFQFLFPGERTRCSRVFRDRYVIERTMSTMTTTFHAIAHSNGTFVVNKAVLSTPQIKLNSIVLAGSVLAPDAWEKCGDGVGKIVNVRASRDFPVGLLCRALAQLSRLHVFGVGLVLLGFCVGALLGWTVCAGEWDAWRESIARVRTQELPSGATRCYVICAATILGFIIVLKRRWFAGIGAAGVDGFERSKTPCVLDEPPPLDGGHGAGVVSAQHKRLSHFLWSNDDLLADDQSINGGTKARKKAGDYAERPPKEDSDKRSVPLGNAERRVWRLGLFDAVGYGLTHSAVVAAAVLLLGVFSVGLAFGTMIAVAGSAAGVALGGLLTFVLIRTIQNF